MAITSSRNIQIQCSGDVSFNLIQSALDNISSPGDHDILTLSSGNNSITNPSSGVTGIVVTSVTIIPPAGNTIQMTLKGAPSDTGIVLHLTDPSTISLDPTQTHIHINAASQINGVQLIWV